jgi:6,7-dimethyl-8-ribityllumazine synthase
MIKTTSPRIAIISSTYRQEVSNQLVEHCRVTLESKGLNQEQIDTFKVPGALEIPLVAKQLAAKGIYGAIIVFGCVLKGKTYHFEQVSNECVQGCMKVAYDSGVPVIFEVLCVYDLKDALERASGTEDNRGVEGALSALKMIEIMGSL